MTPPTDAVSTVDALVAGGVIAVVRLGARTPGALAAALEAGGIRTIEITLTTPSAIETIRELSDRANRESTIIGAGTVLNAESARDAIDAGARFIVSPTFEPEVLRHCQSRDIPCIAGAFSPTEIATAARAGAALVKVFPSGVVGPGYFRDVLAPMPFLRLVPSGGVSLANAGDWIRAGAVAVSVGTALVDTSLASRIGSAETSERASAELTAQARQLVDAVATARRSLEGHA